MNLLKLVCDDYKAEENRLEPVGTVQGRPRCEGTGRDWIRTLRRCQENSGFVGSVAASSQQGHMISFF